MSDRNELVITVKPGTKVRVVESQPQVGERDVTMSIPAELKVAVKRVQGDAALDHLASTITMCG